MSVSITIRNVPNETRNELAARAARSGKSLQEYLKGMLVETASRPTLDEVVARARARVSATKVEIPRDEILAAIHADRR